MLLIPDLLYMGRVFVLILLFSWKLAKSLCSRCSVSQWCVLLCAWYIFSFRNSWSSVLGHFLHCCVDEFLPPLSLFSLPGTVTKILDQLDEPCNFVFFSFIAIIFHCTFWDMPSVFPKSLLNVFLLFLFFYLQELLNLLWMFPFYIILFLFNDFTLFSEDSNGSFSSVMENFRHQAENVKDPQAPFILWPGFFSQPLT